MWYNGGMKFKKQLKRNWPKSLKYTLGFLIIGSAVWAGVILYREDNWVGISALATLLLALGAFWTIRQNYIFHRKERKEKLLNEIIEWANRAARCGYEEHITIPAVFNQHTKSRMDLEALDMIEITARVLSIEGSYISNIAPVFSDSSKILNSKISEVIRRLDMVWRQALKCMQDYHKEHKLPGTKEIKELRESAESLIEEVAKIKTKDLS
jgi:hypothetical protein